MVCLAFAPLLYATACACVTEIRWVFFLVADNTGNRDEESEQND